MNTLMWRLTSQVRISAAALAALAVLLITGIAMAGTYHSFLGTCAAAHTCATLTACWSRAMACSTSWRTRPWRSRCCSGCSGARRCWHGNRGRTHSLAWTQGVTAAAGWGTAGWALAAAALWGPPCPRWSAGGACPRRGRHPLSPVRIGIFDIQGTVRSPTRCSRSPWPSPPGRCSASAPRHGHHPRRIRRLALRHRQIPPAALHDPAHQGVPARRYGVWCASASQPAPGWSGPCPPSGQRAQLRRRHPVQFPSAACRSVAQGRIIRAWPPAGSTPRPSTSPRPGSGPSRASRPASSWCSPPPSLPSPGALS